MKNERKKLKKPHIASFKPHHGGERKKIFCRNKNERKGFYLQPTYRQFAWFGQIVNVCVCTCCSRTVEDEKNGAGLESGIRLYMFTRLSFSCPLTPHSLLQCDWTFVAVRCIFAKRVLVIEIIRLFDLSKRLTFSASCLLLFRIS